MHRMKRSTDAKQGAHRIRHGWSFHEMSEKRISSRLDDFRRNFFGDLCATELLDSVSGRRQHLGRTLLLLVQPLLLRTSDGQFHRSRLRRFRVILEQLLRRRHLW